MQTSGDQRGRKTLIKKSADPGTFTSTTGEQRRDWATKYRFQAKPKDQEQMKVFDVAEERAADVNDREFALDLVENLTPVGDPVCLHMTGESQKIATDVSAKAQVRILFLQNQVFRVVRLRKYTVFSPQTHHARTTRTTDEHNT